MTLMYVRRTYQAVRTLMRVITTVMQQKMTVLVTGLPTHLKPIDPVTGDVMSVDYNFGADNDDSNNEWIGSDFEYANKFYQEGAMGTGHVVTDLIASYEVYINQFKTDSAFLADTLADVAEWFAADEAADAQELADSLTDNYRRFFVMDSTWEKTYNDTLADVAEWFAADELADSLELADTITDMQARYDVMLAHMEDSVSFTLDSAAVAFAAEIAIIETCMPVTMRIMLLTLL